MNLDLKLSIGDGDTLDSASKYLRETATLKIHGHSDRCYDVPDTYKINETILFQSSAKNFLTLDCDFGYFEFYPYSKDDCIESNLYTALAQKAHEGCKKAKKEWRDIKIKQVKIEGIALRKRFFKKVQSFTARKVFPRLLIDNAKIKDNVEDFRRNTFIILQIEAIIHENDKKYRKSWRHISDRTITTEKVPK